MKMEIKLIRKYRKATYTIGDLYVDGEWICNTLEDKDRNLSSDMSEYEIRQIKVKNETCIPYGKYRVTMNVKSPSFSKKQYYKDYCDGYLPRLIDVPGFSGILLHRGSNEGHSSGCVLCGFNTIKGKLTDSQKAFEKLYQILKNAKDKIYITIEKG